MTTKERVPEGMLCDHCHDSKNPLTESNSQNISHLAALMTTAANVHRECAQAWIDANP
jgi:hypothetical protein